MIQLFDFDEDLNEPCEASRWSTKKQPTRSFNQLPEDIWVDIFSFFTTSDKLLNLILISKRLQTPIYKSIKSLKLLGIDHQTTTDNSSNTTNSTRVAYSEDDTWLMSPIEVPSRTRNLSYASKMSTMRRFNQLTKMASSPSATLSSSAPSLTDLYGEKEIKKEVNPILKVLAPFTKITDLSLEFCKALDGETLEEILGRFSHIQSLTIIHCTGLHYINITYPMEVCRNLRRLEIRDCRTIQECAGGIKVDCHLLNHLSITSTPCVNERLISHLIDRNCHTLQTLNLFGLNDFSSISISKKMDVLEKLSLLRCKNFSKFHLPIKQVCTSFPSLKELDLSHTMVNDDAIKILTNEQRLDSLTHLKLESCKQIVKPALGLCKNLESLSLDFCNSLEDIIIPPNNCPALHSLSLNYTRIGDKAIERIFNVPQPVGFDIGLKSSISKLSAKKCKTIFNPKITSYNLEDLDFHGCYNISSVKVVDLSKKSLKRVNLGWTKIDDDNLTKLIETCPSIKELTVNTCDNLVNPTIQSESLQYISFQGAHHLQNPVFKCDKLRHVDFRNCDNLEAPTLVRKKKKIEPQNIYQVRRKLDFGQCMSSSPELNAPDYTPMPSTPVSHKTFEIQGDGADSCDSPHIFHPKMKVIEEGNEDGDELHY